MGNNNELLREYGQSASEAAFAELVQRHVNMVYAAALRETGGDTHRAQELTQLVFIELSRKAAALASHPALAGWLYTSVRWIAANARRAEDRRERRQQEYHAMSHQHSSDSADATWEQVRPALDDSLHELEEMDRAAIVLRFFEDLSLKQVGAQLGLSDNAARMRVDRALEKLHDLLSRRGITSTSSALAAALVVGGVVSAPSSLAATITAGALCSTVAGTVAKAKVIKSTLVAKKLLLAAAAVLGTAASIHFILSHRGLMQ